MATISKLKRKVAHKAAQAEHLKKLEAEREAKRAKQQDEMARITAVRHAISRPNKLAMAMSSIKVG